MRKLIKKAAAFVLAGIMTAGGLTGCVQDVGNDTATQPAKGAESQSSEADAPTVVFAVIKDMSADDEVSAKFLEKVGEGVSRQLGREVTIELAPISDGAYSESVGLLLQSGVIPDLIYFQGGDYQFAVTQEILEDLVPYIESSTYIKEVIQPFNTARMENYPYLLWLAEDRIKVPVVREDWFKATESGEKLLENPSPENYKIFFQELKEKNNLNAVITVPGDLSELDTIFDQAFGNTHAWVQQEGSYVYNKVSYGTKEKLKFYADLYKDGLLDKEYLSKKWDTKESAFYNGDVGVVSGTQGSVVNVYNTKMVDQNGEAAGLLVLPPAKGKAQGYLPSEISKESRGWAISAYSPNKEAAFAILEYMASQEGQILDKLGYEGEHYNKTGEVYELTDKISEWYPRFHESAKNLRVDISKETPYFSPAAVSSLEMTAQYTTFDNNFVLPDDYATNWDAGEALYAEYASDVISGRESIDTFDDFVKKWNELGGKEITAYANEIINTK